MSEIVEIPLENSGNSENPQEIEEPAQEIEETPRAKARPKGRPKGSTNKPKESPAPPVQTKAPKSKKAPPKKTKAPIVYESEEESEEDEIVPKKRSKAPPQVFQAPELDRRSLAADVLQILSEQKFNRAAARRNHYASWFA